MSSKIKLNFLTFDLIQSENLMETVDENSSILIRSNVENMFYFRKMLRLINH